MQTILKHSTWLGAATLILFTGCGQPAGSAGGPPEGDFPASAVVAPALAEAVDETVTLVSTLEARNAVTLVAEVSSTVEEILFEEGQNVKEGDILVRLDDTQTRARLDEATSSFSLSELTLERSKKLLENQTVSQEVYDQAEADFFNRKAALALAEDEQDKTAIDAPFAGVVGERDVSVGQVVSVGMVFTTLNETDRLEAAADVPERYLRYLRPGLEASFSADAYPGEAFTATVTYVAPVVDTASRSVHVKAEVDPSDTPLKPGMFGSLALVLERREASLVIPEAAVQFSGAVTTVVAVNGEGRSEFRPVTLGKRFAGRVEVLEGLAEGELVVVEGHQKMGPGMLVMASPESEKYGVTPGLVGGPPPVEEAVGETR